MSVSVVNRRVLMLNQNYEPLTICTARRAIVLVFQGKAEMIESANGDKIHTVATAFDLPSVVRLWHYKKVPHKRIVLSRKNIFARDGNRCQYCGTASGSMTIDHVTPRRVGGRDTWENLVCACSRCNNKKGDRTPDQAGMKLLKRPARPSYVTFMRQHMGGVDKPWRPYLFMDAT